MLVNKNCIFKNIIVILLYYMEDLINDFKQLKLNNIVNDLVNEIINNLIDKLEIIEIFRKKLKVIHQI